MSFITPFIYIRSIVKVGFNRHPLNKMKKILVLDDDAGILEVIKIILEEKGYLVKTLNNVDGVLSIIGIYKPNLILIDLLMPETNGEEIIKLIKNNSPKKVIPIIILSACQNLEDLTQKCEADDFLCKPFELNELENIVDKYTKTTKKTLKP